MFFTFGQQFVRPGACQLDQIPEFLMIAGSSVSLVLALASAVVLLAVPTVQFCILAYGSYFVIGQYSIWDSRDPESDNFCESITFLLAYISLIIDWILTTSNFLCDVLIVVKRTEEP